MQKPTAPTPVPVVSGRLSRYWAAPCDVLGRAVHRQAHQQPLRLVGLAGGGAVVEVGRQGDEALGGEPVGDVADVVDQPPPLLDDDDARAATGRRHREIAVAACRRCSQS